MLPETSIILSKVIKIKISFSPLLIPLLIFNRRDRVTDRGLLAKIFLRGASNQKRKQKNPFCPHFRFSFCDCSTTSHRSTTHIVLTTDIRGYEIQSLSGETKNEERIFVFSTWFGRCDYSRTHHSKYGTVHKEILRVGMMCVIIILEIMALRFGEERLWNQPAVDQSRDG
jgi:hypothetical protein